MRRACHSTDGMNLANRLKESVCRNFLDLFSLSRAVHSADIGILLMDLPSVDTAVQFEVMACVQERVNEFATRLGS